MAIFNSYFDITRGYIPLNPIKPPFSYGFPMVFLYISLYHRGLKTVYKKPASPRHARARRRAIRRARRSVGAEWFPDLVLFMRWFSMV